MHRLIHNILCVYLLVNHYMLWCQRKKRERYNYLAYALEFPLYETHLRPLTAFVWIDDVSGKSHPGRILGDRPA